ncbi:MAG: zinc ribbon domain-containing protein [Bryobacteraceae bacterium]|jgi:hypothetical protein
MPDYCSCGAQLPADALFCHKCGKPQRELMPAASIIEPEAAPLPAPSNPAPVFAAPAARYAMPMSFRNPAAARTALFVGIAGGLISNLLPLISWLAAGFFAVFFYRRRTHDRLNIAAGMRLGWLTGLIMFTIWGIAFAAMAWSGALTAQLEQRMKSMPFSSNDPAYTQLAHAMTSGPGLLLPLGFGFIVIICLSVAGGALGAKSVGGN